MLAHINYSVGMEISLRFEVTVLDTISYFFKKDHIFLNRLLVHRLLLWYFEEKHKMFPHMIHKGHTLWWISVLCWTCVSCLYKLLWKCQDWKFVWANCTVNCSNKMLQSLSLTNPKNHRMDPHGVNPTLSIFLRTLFPVNMQGLTLSLKIDC